MKRSFKPTNITGGVEAFPLSLFIIGAMNKGRKRIIIFDMDGTLYRYRGGSFRNSGLYDVVIRNTLSYIATQLGKTKKQAQEILDSVLKKYGDSISIGLEKKFKINRYDYFDFAWNIDTENYVRFDPAVKSLLSDLEKNFDLVLLSDAPRVWINRVLLQLDVLEIFGERIFSGEGDVRKELKNIFGEIAKTLGVKPDQCIVVGDQEDTDIVPAKAEGMKTVYIGNSKIAAADHVIDNILELKDIKDL